MLLFNYSARDPQAAIYAREDEAELSQAMGLSSDPQRQLRFDCNSPAPRARRTGAATPACAYGLRVLRTVCNTSAAIGFAASIIASGT